MIVGSFVASLVRTAIVIPSAGRWRTSDRNPVSRPEWPSAGRPSSVVTWTPSPYPILGRKRAVLRASPTIPRTVAAGRTSPL